MDIRAIFGLSLTFILIILGLIFKKSKKIYILQIIWLWIMIGLNSGGSDFNNNYYIYLNADFNSFNSSSDILYIYICAIFKYFNCSFIFMNSILTIIALYFLFSKVHNFTNNVCVVGSLFLIYPFIESIIQKRFFLASSLVVFAFFKLLQNKNKYNFKALIFILIASLIHSSTIIYVLFWLLYNVPENKLKKYLFIFLPLSYLFIPYFPKIALLFFDSSKVNLYFYTLKLSLLDTICWTILHLIFIIIIYLIKKNQFVNHTKEKMQYENNVYKLMIISLLLLPLYYFEPTFIRIFRSILIFAYIIIANRDSKIKKEKIYSIIWVNYLIAVWLMIFVFTGLGFDILVTPEFENNVFLTWLFGGNL